MAVKAAAEQGPEAAARYLRALREGLMCFRRKLDAPEALVEEARSAGLDAARFRLDLASNAIVEAFAGDLGRTRSLDPGRFTLPCFEVGSEGCVGPQSHERLREAALAAGAPPPAARAPEVLAALGRFGRMAGVEVEAVWTYPDREPTPSCGGWRRMASEAGASADRNALGASLEPFARPAQPHTGSSTTPAAVVAGRSARRLVPGGQDRRSPRPRLAGTTQQKPQPMLNTACISAGSIDRARRSP